MNSEVFLNTKLSSIGEFRNGATFSKDDFGEGFGIVSVKQLFSGRYASFDNLETVISSAISKPEGLFLRDGDILFARSSVKRSGSGQVCMVSNPPENLIFSGFIIRFRVTERDNAHPRFLNYLLRSPVYRELFQRIANGTTIFNLSQDVLADVDISLPSLAYQKEIAHILDTLDAKIELNRRNNETLEGTAKALFKSWFIDFDPVRANAEGLATGLRNEISDLFPDSFENSELGMIPKGWEISKLGNLVFPCGESTKPSKELANQPYVPINCISSKSLTLTNFKPGSEAKSSLITFRKGDILFGAMRPYFHKVCIAPFDGITRSTCIPLRQIESSFHAFATLIISNKETIEYATQNSTGSTIPYIRWKDNLENMKIKKPPKHISKCFDNIIEPILEKFCCSILFQKTLSETRDALLPKLISGKLRIPDAEKILEEAGI